MRLLSGFCGLTFSVMAGYLLAFSTVSEAQQLTPGTVFWMGPGLAVLGLALALKTRSEGWVALATGSALFLLALLLMPVLGIGGAGFLALAAGGQVLIALVRTPGSYWRVVG